MQKTSVKGKKSIHFQNKRVHNLETLGKKRHSVRDFITEALWKTF